MSFHGLRVSFKDVCTSLRWQGWLFWSLFSLGLAFLSAALVGLASGPSINVHQEMTSAFVATFAGLLCFWVVLWFAAARWVRENLLPFYDSLTASYFTSAVIISSMVIISILLISNGFDFGTMVTTLILESPGGIFTLLTGLFTMAGVYITLKSLLEMRQTITSFSQFASRVRWMIENTEEDDQIRCLTYTPAMGSLALPKAEWDRLYSSLQSAHVKIEMVCLAREELPRFHSLFLGRRTDRNIVSQGMVEEANKKAEILLNAFESVGIPPSFRTETRLPGYYMFTNRNRAIVAAPFFMPVPAHALTPDQIQKLPSVQMFGFETSDATVVSAIHRMLDLYSGHSYSTGPESEPKLTSSQRSNPVIFPTAS
jgi:hypothetical protein